MDPKPSFAVLLAVYNGTQWLGEQLNSILNQVGVDVTVFVSVDVSADGSEDWIDRRAASDPRINVMPHGMRFGGAARNFFRILREIDCAKFDYISFADQDDIWGADKLQRAHKVLLETGADGYSSDVIAFWPNGRKVLVKKSQQQAKWDFLFEAAGPGCTYVMKSHLASAIQSLLQSRWNDMQSLGLHDWFSYAFARANDYRWIIDDYAGMLYRQHDGNQFGVNVGARAFLARARAVLNGWGLTQSALIASLVHLKNKDPFIARWLEGSRLGVLGLALHAGSCRRRIRDKFLFALSCLVLCMVGRRKQ